MFISSFFDFLNVFHFFIFSEEKVSSFLFSCISFKYLLLLALVSELNCFLRSRCSMEMCPVNIGRDIWDWVGPPAWERACFNSPEWGGGSSPVKTEPPQIVLLLLLLLVFDASLQTECVRPQTLRINWQNNWGLNPPPGESEKCALSTKNAPHHHTGSSS